MSLVMLHDTDDGSHSPKATAFPSLGEHKNTRTREANGKTTEVWEEPNLTWIETDLLHSRRSIDKVRRYNFNLI